MPSVDISSFFAFPKQKGSFTVIMKQEIYVASKRHRCFQEH